MKYEVTGICGHTYTVNLIGPNKNREYRLERLKSECCPCCKEEIRKAEIERENNEAAEKSAEMELPELQGSSKQVAWANSIKIRMLNELSGLAEHVNKNYSEKFDQFTDEIINNTSAKWFIDSRDIDLRAAFKDWYEEHKDDDRKEEIDAETTEVVKPENSDKPGIVEIKTDSENITAVYVKDDDFIKICKSFEFKWTGKAWEKKISKYNGGTERAVELGYNLLKAGFVVKADKELAGRMVSGNFNKEQKNWVDFKGGKIVLIWEKYSKKSDIYFSESKKLHGSRWSDGFMTVPVDSYQEIRDFAEINGFCISYEAEEAMNAAEEMRNKIETSEISEHEEEKVMTREEILEKKLMDDSVIPELLDTDDETDTIEQIIKSGYTIIPGKLAYRNGNPEIAEDCQGRAVTVKNPKGEFKSVDGKFDMRIYFGKNKIETSVGELVKYAYGYDDRKYREVERRMSDEDYKKLSDMKKEIGFISSDIELYGEIPDDFSEVSPEIYIKGNIAKVVRSFPDEWSIETLMFDHSPSVEEIEESERLSRFEIDCMVRYRA